MALPVPFSKCWWVSDRLLAGPAFFGHSPTELEDNMQALEAAGITNIVSLVPFSDYFVEDTEENEWLMWEINRRFSWRGFNIRGAAPDSGTMQSLLGWIDLGAPDTKAFVHCASGRGRSGTVAGCWLARHGVASGEAVLARLAELRTAAGLSLHSPETDLQRELVTSWRKGQ